jgi:hypothetical protein
MSARRLFWSDADLGFALKSANLIRTRVSGLSHRLPPTHKPSPSMWLARVILDRGQLGHTAEGGCDAVHQAVHLLDRCGRRSKKARETEVATDRMQSDVVLVWVSWAHQAGISLGSHPAAAISSAANLLHANSIVAHPAALRGENV